MESNSSAVRPGVPAPGAEHSRRARRSSGVALGVTALLASALLTGCSPDGEVIDADYAKVCQNRTTEERAEDDRCSEQGASSGLYGWYFLAMGAGRRSIPAVGAGLSGGTTSVPSGATSRAGFSPDGASSVSRGGFGSSNSGTGG
ncbi:tRNA-dihydrouridine synthase [Arthrobacter sp. B0490]|uniref:tRNA-dihydrouridine synthase n=1 Tax=Arthrobacter sp. B0490 TaxID=2058891 RepID=UPI00215754FB|nr:tRNA-dihydrouridine synthase [Arthrobacter sp. B0490]